jgi:triacylglycerol lipase
MNFVRTALRSIAVGAFALMAGCAGSHDADGSAAGSSDLTEGEEHFPIVLAHGFFGFKNFAGVDFLTYFFGVEADLKAHGESQVFTPEVDPFNDSTTRGAQLEARILDILKQTGAKKVNIIGHSQGGLDARVVAHNRPDIVASVTTIGSPHSGSHLADVVMAPASIPIVGPVSSEVIDSLVRVIGAPLWDQLGHDSSVVRSIAQTTTAGMRDFNQHFTDSPGVRYFSIAGRTALSDGGDACKVASAPTFIARANPIVDTTDLLLTVPELVTAGLPLADEPNDGFIRVSEAQHGTFLGCIPADHFDEIGQLVGDPAGLGNDWNYLEFYRGLVAELRSAGL